VRRENWLDQLQDAIIDLLTCRDTGDDERRRTAQGWWVCAEGFDSVCDGGGSESPHHRHRGSTLDMAFLEVGGAGPEWSAAELPRELTEKPVAGLGAATSLPPAQPPFSPAKPGPRKSTAEPVPPRAARISTSHFETPPIPPPATPLRLPADRPIRQLGVGRRLGPAALSTAVPAKLGDMPAPSFQVMKTTGCSTGPRAEPLSVSGVSTTSGSASLSGAAASGGGMTLNILLQGERWVALHFTRVDDMDRRAADFVQEQRLSVLIKAGLAQQLRQMVAMRQLSAAVDVVDLL